MEWLQKIDPTVLAALLAAFSAIIAPIVTSCINNRHQYRMRKLEIAQEEKIKAIQHYAEACSNYISHPARDELVEYSRAYGKIFLYTDKSCHDDIKAIDKSIENQKLQDSSNMLAKVCEALSSEMKI